MCIYNFILYITYYNILYNTVAVAIALPLHGGLIAVYSYYPIGGLHMFSCVAAGGGPCLAEGGLSLQLLRPGFLEGPVWGAVPTLLVNAKFIFLVEQFPKFPLSGTVEQHYILTLARTAEAPNSRTRKGVRRND